jgi:hypothetical protein
MKPLPVWLFAVFIATQLCANNEYDDYLAQWKAKCAPLLAEWRKPEKKNDAELRNELIDAAVRAEQPEIVEEVAAGGDVASMEIKLPPDARQIVAKSLRSFTEIPGIPYSNGVMDCVIRRMTKTRFEVWTPKHGWLFNAKGQLVNEALPPRRDGIGRGWHGAFLPDGRWVTTDLWEMDKTLTFFSPGGKFSKEIKAVKLAPPKKDDEWSLSLIGWARCDRHGEGWVVSVGDGPGRARVFVKPDGSFRELSDGNAPWKLCYPRDLEPKGMYTSLSRPSDDCKQTVWFEVPSHGAWCGSPTYHWSEKDDDGKVIPDGDSNFGFLPGTHDVFIGASDGDNGDEEKPRKLKTWFFSNDGKCRGWVRAAYLTDSADGKAMWFLDEENCVVALSLDLKQQSRTRFVIGGENARPVKLFTDLRLGFFSIGKRLVLARW